MKLSLAVIFIGSAAAAGYKGYLAQEAGMTNRAQGTDDTNCIGAYGRPKCSTTPVGELTYLPSSVSLEAVYGGCQDHGHSKAGQAGKYKTNEEPVLTQKMTLRLQIDQNPLVRPQQTFNYGLYISGNVAADSKSSSDCQHYFLNPITVQPAAIDETSGYGPFATFPDLRCGFVVGPQADLVVDAELICTRKSQTKFTGSYCISYGNSRQRSQCGGLFDAIPYQPGPFPPGDWTPCACTSFNIDTEGMLEDNKYKSSSYSARASHSGY